MNAERNFLFACLIFALVIYAIHAFGLFDLLTDLPHLQTLIRQSGLFGYSLYILLFIIATLFLLPGSILVIAGGIVFGPLLGTLLSLIAATLASSSSFLLARWLGRDLLLKYVGHSHTFQAIEKGIARNGIDFLILTRLIPLFPYNIQNYAYGLTTIAFWPYTLISALTTLPGIVIYTVMASDLANEGITLRFILQLCLAGLALFILVQLAKLYARHKHVDLSASRRSPLTHQKMKDRTMSQHYSVSWKKGLAALCLLAVAGLSGCDQKENAAGKVEYDGLSNSQPLRVDANNHTVTMLVQINGRFLTDVTRHGIVFKDGSNGHKSLFMAYATPKAFYEALKEAGGTPGENMTMDNKETTLVTGSKLDISVNWQGAAKAYSFDEVIVDSNGKKLDMRFGGNLTAAEEKKTGCLVCLDSCPVGIVSNATYTYGAVEKRGEVKFKGNASVLPADNTLATVTFKITE
ncbi:TPA: TVP38/TMEM64 family protein [Escherichia coli]|nr:TVP38/TMEM64 family protein [Escherichia coli]